MFKEKSFFEKNPDEERADEIIIPEDEYEIIFSRSSGKGGQNVNKVSTKATLIWNVLESRVLDEEQKQKVMKFWRKRISSEASFIIYSQSERSQWQNRQDVIKKLNRFVNEALKPVKERKATKPTFTSRERRLQEKKKESEKKKLRQKIKF